MADPVFFEVATNPCAQCAGPRQVAEMAWRDPTFSVTCQGCGQVAAGESQEAAVTAWNEANPPRQVDEDAQKAVQVTLMKASAHTSFATTLHQAAQLYGPSQPVQDFVDWAIANTEGA